MKKITNWCLVLVAILPFLGQAQGNSQPIDARLTIKWDKTYLEQMAESNPLWLARWTFYLDHAWHVTAYPAEKMSADMPTISITDLSNINVFELEATSNTKMLWNKQAVYRISGSDKVLVYESGQRFNELWNLERGLNPPPHTGVKLTN